MQVLLKLTNFTKYLLCYNLVFGAKGKLAVVSEVKRLPMGGK